VDVDAVIRALDEIGPGPEAAWRSMDVLELVDHIERVHHGYLHEALPRYDALAEKVVAVHGERHPELRNVARVFKELRADLEPHLAKEERVLFPMIRQLAGATTPPEFFCGSLRNPISAMMIEHEATGTLLSALRVATSGYETPPDGCASYQALFDGFADLEHDTHLHIHKENNLLFPAVVALEEALVDG